jgi:hypothetical protein
MKRLSLPRTLALILIAAGVIGVLAACAPPAIAPETLGDYVWQDDNRNGLQDPLEPGVARVEVALYREDDTLVDSTLTNAQGLYHFEGLPSGRYYLSFTVLQAGFTPRDEGIDDEADSDVNPLTGRTDVFDFSKTDLTRDVGLILLVATETPQPPQPPLEPTPTPVVPPEGGKYRMTITFVWVSGECGLPKEFVDTVDFNLSAADQTTGSHATTLNQSSTGDINVGQTLPNGEGQASSARESYTYTLEFVLDETGKVVRVIVRGINKYTSGGCETVYEIEGEGVLVE